MNNQLSNSSCRKTKEYCIDKMIRDGPCEKEYPNRLIIILYSSKNSQYVQFITRI